MRLVLFQPDIPQNTGTMITPRRLSGGSRWTSWKPAGFDVSDRHFRRSGMDYLDRVAIIRHPSWRAFHDWSRANGLRLVLATVQGSVPYTDFGYAENDAIIMGRESAGAPDYVHEACDARIPHSTGTGDALAQCRGLCRDDARRSPALHGRLSHDDAAALTRGTKDGHFLEHPRTTSR